MKDKRKMPNTATATTIVPVLALCTMGSRVYLMVHYATDVLCGLIVGTLAGIIGYFLMKLCIMLIDKVKPFTFTVLDSQTNFLFATHSSINMKDYFEWLKTQKVFIRYFNLPKIDNYFIANSVAYSHSRKASAFRECACYNKVFIFFCKLNA